MSEKKRKSRKVVAPSLPDPTPAFDIGFQVQEVNNLENQLGTAAIHTEDVMQGLSDQMDTHLAKAETATTLIQGNLRDQLASHLALAQANTDAVQHSLDVSMSGQIGRALEASAMLSPNDPTIQRIFSKPAALPVAGSGPPPSQYQPSDIGIVVEPTLGALPSKPVVHTPIGGGQPLPFLPPPTSGYRPNPACPQPGTIFTGGSNDPIAPCPPSGGTIGSGPPPGYTPPPPVMTLPPPTSITPGQLPTQPTPQNPYCPPITIKFPDCIKFCPDETKPPPLQKYCLYCTDKGVMYFVKDTDPAKNTNDKKLFCGDVKELSLGQYIDQCRKPPTQDQPPYPPSAPSWNIPGAQGAVGCGNLFNYNVLTTPLGNDFFQQLFDNSSQNLDPIFGTGSDTVNNILTAARNGLMTVAGGLLDAVVNGIGKAALLNCSGTPNEIVIATSQLLTGFVRKWVGDVATPQDVSLQYARNALCQYLIPSAEDATKAYLTDSIDVNLLRCIVEANGQKWNSWTPIVDSNRTRWNAGETLMLWRREFISKDFANNYLRELGYLNDIEKEGLQKLTEQLPAVSDIISMMLRDVADEVNIDWSNSDRIFKDKYTGQLKQWGKFQGIPDEMMKNLWRAHWVLPSPTQLFEFWQRLRKTGDFGTEAEFLKKIKGVLLQNDYHPDWIDAFMAVATRPLTRIDAGRAFEIGVVSRDDLKLVYNQLGYDDKNADTLVEYKTKQLIEKAKRSTYVKAYARGEVSIGELDQILRSSGLTSDFVQPSLDWAKQLLRIERRKVCVKGYKKRFMLGELDVGQVSSSLAQDGLDPDQVNELIEGWKCEKAQRGKHVPMSTNCQWYQFGLIDEVELYTRAKNLGYNEDDAAKLTRDCMIRQGIKMDKERMAELARQKRLAKEQDAAERRLARQLAKQLHDAAANASKAQTVREHRQKMLIQMADDWSQKTGMSLPDAAIEIRKIINKAVVSGLASINTIYQAGLTMAKDPNIITLDQFVSEMAGLLSDVVDLPESLPAPPSVGTR